MAEVINLRLARKAKARNAAGKQADANRAKFSQSKAQRDKQSTEVQRIARELDGKRRDS